MRPETLAGLELETCEDDKFDFSDEEITRTDDSDMITLMTSMAEEEHVEPLSIPSSERVTKTMRPMIRSKEENGG